jgi:gliding motility-associated lipoprotein GldH
MMEMNKLGSSFLVFMLLLLFSCSNNRIYEQFHSFQDAPWMEKDSILFELGEVKSLGGKSLIAVRFNENYSYSNCYIRVVTKDSSKAELQNKLLNVPIFDPKSGLPLGDGFGSTFTKYDTLPFDLAEGTKEVVLIQYMRQPELVGIEAVGLKIVKP